MFGFLLVFCNIILNIAFQDGEKKEGGEEEKQGVGEKKEEAEKEEGGEEKKEGNEEKKEGDDKEAEENKGGEKDGGCAENKEVQKVEKMPYVPKELHWKAEDGKVKGGMQKIKLMNTTGRRQAFKVFCLLCVYF